MAINETSMELAIDEIKNILTISQYYRDNVDPQVDLVIKERQICPLHDDDTPSFTYYPTTDTFYCFGCGKGGSVVEFHLYFTKLTDESYNKPKAIIDLSKMYDIKIPNLFSTPPLPAIMQKKNSGLGLVKREDLKLPLKTVLARIERQMKIIKEKDLEKYIDKVVELDTLIFVGIQEDIENFSKSISRSG